MCVDLVETDSLWQPLNMAALRHQGLDWPQNNSAMLQARTAASFYPCPSLTLTQCLRGLHFQFQLFVFVVDVVWSSGSQFYLRHVTHKTWTKMYLMTMLIFFYFLNISSINHHLILCRVVGGSGAYPSFHRARGGNKSWLGHKSIAGHNLLSHSSFGT